MADFTLHHQPQKSTNRYQILVHSVVPCGLLLDRRRVVSFYKRNVSAALQRSFPYLGFIMQIHPPKKHKSVNSAWFHDLVSICFALGYKSGSFCEAVNCERSEQEGKFLFAMLVSSYWFHVLVYR